ncbi:hypothetical protein NQ117_19810 [Paenibacillus sp. SC116]|uniref:Uncharacterized protein n=1 Tax=Paenibacillus arenosi TaxID=2774142 RepID=A0ABR9AXV1_9BACL|nr:MULTISPECIES: hypothetical protein [Paenibacillus]MBD8498961.1 hypothetical protein [Paenibacillus arenosi]MCR8845932.1 hypothetical protein [Paenibacillus sp. SC116]
MPYNRAERIHQLQNKSRFTEKSITLKSNKAARRAPSLNNIPKQEV